MSAVFGALKVITNREVIISDEVMVIIFGWSITV